MRSGRKISIQEKRIKTLEEKLRQEKELSEELNRENENLKNEIEALNSRTALIQNQAKDIIENFKKETKQVNSLRNEYEDLIKETKAERKKYKNKMANLLKHFEKQI